MRGSAEVGEENDIVLPILVGAQEAEAPGKMCCDIPKSINRVVMAI